MGRSNNSFQNYFINSTGGSNLKMEPEQKLFIAILSQAVHDAFKTADKLFSSSRKIQVTLGGCEED